MIFNNCLAQIKTLNYIIPFFLFFNFIVVGIVASYLNISQMYWVGALVPLLLILQPNKARFFSDNMQLVLFYWLIYLGFNWLFLTGSSLKAIAIKDYIIPSIALFIASRVVLSHAQLSAIYKLIRLIVMIQFPFILSQFFITARASTARTFDWDLISGTFGFNPQGGGGNSAGLLLFLCFYCTMAVKKIRLKQASQLDVLAIVLSIACVLMMETKIVIVLIIFIIIAILEPKEFFKPKIILGSSLFITVFVVALVANYSSNFSMGSKEGRSITEYITDISDGYSKEDLIDYSSGEVSRQAAIDIWLTNNVNQGIGLNTLFGYGLTSSKFSNANNIEAVVFASPIDFAASQLTIYLWDIGIFGVLILLFLLLYIFLTVVKYRAKGGDDTVFKSGKLFLVQACLLFPFYSNAMHINSVTFSIFILFLLCINSQSKISGSL
jgi:hypothetical protein